MKTKVPEIRFKEFSGEWEEKRLKDILDYERPEKYIVKNTDYNDNYNVPVLTANKSFILGYTNEEEGIYTKIPVIIFDDFTTDNKYVDFSFKVKSSAIKILIAKENNNIKFIYELMQLIKFEKTEHKRYYISEYQNIKILIPPTPQEQQKIADTFTTLDNLIVAYTKKFKLLEEHKKGLLQKMFPRNGKKVPEIRFKEFSGEWEEKRLGEIGKIITGKTPKTSDSSLWNGDILFITPTDIDEKNKYQEQTERTVTKTDKLQILPEKTIVYTCIASIGKMAMTVKPSITNQQINSIIPKKDYDNKFIYYSLLNITPYIISTQANNTLPIINKTEFSNFEISIPPTPQEQQKIADTFTTLDNLIEAYTKELKLLEKHKKGLLQKMFVR